MNPTKASLRYPTVSLILAAMAVAVGLSGLRVLGSAGPHPVGRAVGQW